MNFLELINKCLLELNYKTINSISELTKNDHKRIVNILNIINKEVCMAENWNFMIRRTYIGLPANETEITNRVPGRILYMLTNDNQKYEYTEDYNSFIYGNPKPRTFSSLGNKLLFPPSDKDLSLYVVYHSKNCVVNSNGIEKPSFELINDESLIPEPFAEPILVYGTCLRLKGNPQHFKFPYWMSMYKDALLNLKSKNSVSANSAATIRLHRQ